MKTLTKIIVPILLAITCISALTLLLPYNASADGPWYVEPDGNDSNTCLNPGPANACASIQSAVDKATSGDTILVAGGIYTGTGDWVVLIEKDLTISGGWDSAFIAQNSTTEIDGEDTRQVIGTGGGTSVKLESLTVKNGFYNGSGSAPPGGGINHDGNSLFLTNLIIHDNQTNKVGGGVYSRGISLTIVDSIISNNYVGNKGGGIFLIGTTMTISNTSVTQNESLSGGAGGAGGGIFIEAGATMSITQSIISNNKILGINSEYSYVNINQSTISGNTGEGIRNYNSTMHINNSTISGNGSGVSDGSAIHNYQGNLTLHSSTVTANKVGGITSSYGSMVIKNSIVAQNIKGVYPGDCQGSVVSHGYNLLGDFSMCSITLQIGDIITSDLGLGPIFETAGLQRFHSLLPGSPAIYAGDPSGCTDHLGNPLDIDQRSASRSGPCDIGAVVYIPPGTPTSIQSYSGTPQRTPPSFDFWLPLQAGVIDDNGSPVAGIPVKFTAPENGSSVIFADSGTFTASIQTDDSGLVTTAIVANEFTGSYTVEATIPGVQTGTDFLLSNDGWYVTPDGIDTDDCHSAGTSCSHIEAVLAKPDFSTGDTLLVARGIYTKTDTGGFDDQVVFISKTVRILGGWDQNFSSQPGYTIIDGRDIQRGITVDDFITVYIEKINIINGNAWFGIGGGIYNQWNNLTLSNIIISNTQGGGIYNYGNLTMENTDIRQNQGNAGITNGNGFPWLGILTMDNCKIIGSTGSRGLMNNESIIFMTDTQVISHSVHVGEGKNQVPGGGIWNWRGDVVIVSSEISNNEAWWGGGISNGDGNLTIYSSSIDNNYANAGGGGIQMSGGNNVVINSSVANNSGQVGGGITVYRDVNSLNRGYLELINSTVSGNYAYMGSGGGILNGNVGFLVINNSTISQNEATEDGGGVQNLSNGVITFTNSIIANNFSSMIGNDCHGSILFPIMSEGYNLIGDTNGCDFITGAGDLLSYDPVLGPFDATLGVHPLLPGSPAINAGNPDGCYGPGGELLVTDQRGVYRIDRCDIGAYELVYQVYLPTIFK